MNHSHYKDISLAVLDIESDHSTYYYVGNGQHKRFDTRPTAVLNRKPEEVSSVFDLIENVDEESSEDPSDKNKAAATTFYSEHRKHVTKLKEKESAGYVPTVEEMVMDAIYTAISRLSHDRLLPPTLRTGKGPLDLERDLVSDGWEFVNTFRGVKGNLPTLLERYDASKGTLRAWLAIPLKNHLWRKAQEQFGAGKDFSKVLGWISNKDEQTGEQKQTPIYPTLIRGMFDDGGEIRKPSGWGPVTDTSGEEVFVDTFYNPFLTMEENQVAGNIALMNEDLFDFPEMPADAIEDLEDVTRAHPDIAKQYIKEVVSSAVGDEEEVKQYCEYKGMLGYAKKTITELSEETGIPTSTLHDRLKRTEKKLFKAAQGKVKQTSARKKYRKTLTLGTRKALEQRHDKALRK